MITASHNPWQDNGIKVIDSDGGQLESTEESTIVDLVHSQPGGFQEWFAKHYGDSEMRK